MDINSLCEQKREKYAAACEIRDRVYDKQDGEWRGDDVSKFEALTGEVDVLSQQIDRLAKLDSIERSLEQAEQPRERRSAPADPSKSRSRGKISAEDRTLALHGWLAASSVQSSVYVTDRQREAAQRCGISLDQRQIVLRMAPFAPAGLSSRDMADWEERTTQVDVVSPDLGGHYTVPPAMQRPLEVALLQFGAMRQVSEVLRTPDGRVMTVPTLNDTSNKGRLVSELGARNELDVTYNQIQFDAYMYTSDYVGMSLEYLQDNGINAAGRIGSILGERIGRITNEHFTTGDGSGKPKGIVAAAANSTITTSGATTITYDNVIDLKHSVDPAYRDQGARFMFNDTTLKILKKIKVAQFSGDTGGVPLWRAGMAAGEPNTIDGDPYTVNQQMASGTGTKAMIYGLLSKYLVRDVMEFQLKRLDELHALNGIVSFLGFSRHDGDLLDAGTNPVKYLTMG